MGDNNLPSVALTLVLDQFKETTKMIEKTRDTIVVLAERINVMERTIKDLNLRIDSLSSASPMNSEHLLDLTHRLMYNEDIVCPCTLHDVKRPRVT